MTFKQFSVIIRYMKKLILLVLLVSSLLFTGCNTTKRNLDPAGPYKKDVYLYTMDKSIVDSYLIVDSFLKWESDNNDYIKTNIPAVFSIANQIRENAPSALNNVNKARKAYISYFNSPVGNFESVSNNLLSEVSVLQSESQNLSNLAASSPLSNSFNSTLNVTTNNTKISIDYLLCVLPVN